MVGPYPFQVISGVWRKVYQAVFIKEVQVVLLSHLYIFDNQYNCEHTMSPGWESPLPGRWS